MTILKAAGEKQLFTWKGSLIRLTDNFSSETMEVGSEYDISSAERKKILSTENSIYDKMKKFRYNSDKQKLRGFITSRLVLQEMLNRASRLKRKQDNNSKPYKEEFWLR